MFIYFYILQKSLYTLIYFASNLNIVGENSRIKWYSIIAKRMIYQYRRFRYGKYNTSAFRR